MWSHNYHSVDIDQFQSRGQEDLKARRQQFPLLNFGSGMPGEDSDEKRLSRRGAPRKRHDGEAKEQSLIFSKLKFLIY